MILELELNVMKINESVTGPIIILGAKPNPALPDVKAHAVITANNAAEIGVLYREKYGSKLIAMSASRVLRDREDVQNAFKKSQPDEIVLLGNVLDSPEDFIHNKLGLKNTEVTILNPQERNNLMLKIFDWKKYLLMAHILWIRGFKNLIRFIIPDLFGKREMSWLNRSTGTNATLYAMTRFPHSREIITAGIGLQKGTHFNSKGQFKSKDALADRVTMKYWSPQTRKQVYTTDSVMNELGKVQKWEGETFSIS